MRILIAPDKFKGTLTAAQASGAMRRGAERAALELGIPIQIDVCPIADGGEGTLEALRGAFGDARRRRLTLGGEPRIIAEWMTVDRSLPMRDRPIALRLLTLGVVIAALIGLWLVLHLHLFSLPAIDERPWLVWTGAILTLTALGVWGFARLTRSRPLSPVRGAYIEAARLIGPDRQRPGARDPERVSSAPVGELIRAALRDGCGRIIIGLGGSASADGGIGLASSLGIDFNPRRAGRAPMSGADLAAIARVSCSRLDRRVNRAEITALCDVASPLLGPTGAARMFGPQKGATPEQVERLELGLARLARACREAGLPCNPDAPGSGAAGGLGFGLATFLGARLVPGADTILDLVDFDRRLRGADLVLTGEGRMDAQTALGKAPAAVANRAAPARVPCIAIVGATEGHAETVRARLASAGVRFARIISLTDRAGSPQGAMAGAAGLVEESAREAVLQAAGARLPTTL